MAAGPLHRTLVANTVTTVTLDLPDPVGNITSFASPPLAQVEVFNLSGSAEVYFTTDGSAPVVGGDACYVLPAVMCTLTVNDGTPGPTSTVKLISAGTPRVSVRAG